MGYDIENRAGKNYDPHSLMLDDFLDEIARANFS